MMTVKEVSKLSGVSVRTLQYYDSIGLLKPTDYTNAGYRLYTDKDLVRLQQIMLFKELEFTLADIKKIIDAPSFNVREALLHEINILTMRKEHLDKIILLARQLLDKGEMKMNFSAFDTKKIDEYSKKAKEKWGDTQAYKQYEEKTKGRTNGDDVEIANGLMNVFVEFGQVIGLNSDDEKVLLLVKKLQDYISKNYYLCTKEILIGLSAIYQSEEFKENIDKQAGVGTAEFVAKAIKEYCK